MELKPLQNLTKMQFWTLVRLTMFLFLTMGCDHKINVENYKVVSLKYKNDIIVLSKDECSDINLILKQSSLNKGDIKSYNKYKLILCSSIDTSLQKEIILFGGFKYFIFDKKLYKSEEIILPKSVLKKLEITDPKSIL